MAAHRIACLGLNALYSTIYAPKQVIKLIIMYLNAFIKSILHIYDRRTKKMTFSMIATGLTCPLSLASELLPVSM